MEKEKIETSIVKTLSYFDQFDYPLTARELYKNLWKSPEVKEDDFYNHLKEISKTSDKIASNGAFYFLPGRGEAVANRQKKINYIYPRLRSAKKAAKFFRFIPFFKAMYVCNQLPITVSDTSDVDVFIVVKAGRLWITRMLITVAATLGGFRRHGKKISNHVCLSFYATDDAINLESIRKGDPDVYLAYWITELIPVYDPNNLRNDILRYNEWQQKLIPNAQLDYTLAPRYRVEDTKFSKTVKRFFEIAWGTSYGDIIEKQAKEIQKKKMDKNQESKQNNPDSDVIVSDKMLKFHENDRRELFQKGWEDRLKKFGLTK